MIHFTQYFGINGFPRFDSAAQTIVSSSDFWSHLCFTILTGSVLCNTLNNFSSLMVSLTCIHTRNFF